MAHSTVLETGNIYWLSEILQACMYNMTQNFGVNSPCSFQLHVLQAIVLHAESLFWMHRNCSRWDPSHLICLHSATREWARHAGVACIDKAGFRFGAETPLAWLDLSKCSKCLYTAKQTEKTMDIYFWADRKWISPFTGLYTFSNKQKFSASFLKL